MPEGSLGKKPVMEQPGKCLFVHRSFMFMQQLLPANCLVEPAMNSGVKVMREYRKRPAAFSSAASSRSSH